MSHTFGDFIAAMEHRRKWAAEQMAAGRRNKDTGRVLLASQYGIWDPLRLPGWLLLSNGQPSARVDRAPQHRAKHRPADVDGYGHHCPEIPSYEAIPTTIAALTKKADDDALRLGALGLSVQSKGAAIIHERIRGVCRALWLFHLWNADDVRTVRRTYYHPDDVKGYWPLAWQMHGNGEKHADAMAYLDVLCAEWAARSGKRHAGRRYHKGFQALLNASTEAA